MPDRFFFLHLHKTGGTALWQRLNEAFEPHELYPGPGDGTPPATTVDVATLLERWNARGSEIRVLTGHFPLCTAELLGGGFTTFTLLREPVERVLSGLRHYREKTPSMAEASLEEIYDKPVQHLMRPNHMVKMLSLTAAEMTDGALTEVEFTPARLEAATTALEALDLVGVQSRFDLFCDALVERYGWNLGRPRFANRTQPVEVTSEFRERIAADNADDLTLYERALRVAC